mgnify:CR=1 FL=1
MQAAKLKVYRASAGSGKTFQLTVDYLSLVFTRQQPDYFSKILAITFTNKATQELKERIINTLTEIKDKNLRFLNTKGWQLIGSYTYNIYIL